MSAVTRYEYAVGLLDFEELKIAYRRAVFNTSVAPLHREGLPPLTKMVALAMIDNAAADHFEFGRNLLQAISVRARRLLRFPQS